MVGDATAVGIFAVFVAMTLAITGWASRRARTASQFYAAGGAVTPGQNGLAIAGDYLSAGSFLGTISVFHAFGVDGLLYAVGAAAEGCRRKSPAKQWRLPPNRVRPGP